MNAQNVRFFYGSRFALSTDLIKSNYKVFTNDENMKFAFPYPDRYSKRSFSGPPILPGPDLTLGKE